jgi:hypothetical protein
MECHIAFLINTRDYQQPIAVFPRRLRMNVPIVCAGAAVTLIWLPIMFALLRKLFPAQAVPPSGRPIAELRAKYHRWVNMLGVLMFLAGVLFAIGLWFAMGALASWSAHQLPTAIVTFAPVSPRYWAVPSLLLGLACGGMASMWIVRRLLGVRYPEFLDYWCQSSGMNSVRANVFVFQVSAALCVVLISLGLRAHVQLTDEALVVNGIFSSSEVTYPLAEIRNIQTSGRFVAPNGQLVLRREYVVHFSDGRHWSTTYIPSDPDFETKRNFIGMISDRAGKPIEEVALFTKNEL